MVSEFLERLESICELSTRLSLETFLDLFYVIRGAANVSFGGQELPYQQYEIL